MHGQIWNIKTWAKNGLDMMSRNKASAPDGIATNMLLNLDDVVINKVPDIIDEMYFNVDKFSFEG